ncbi:unnamed protein product [Tilletia controversa]|nr:hypothetical protein CF336_g9620 [Tilletia laevis]CAD6899913.1 unnamed protein product [Tilletia controversa]
MHGSQLQHTAGINHGDLEIFNIALGALSLEPFSSSPPRFSDKWLPSYNLQWGIGDLIAGITVALLLVSQSMCYAQLLQPDVTIGPVAVMSLQTGQAITKVLARHPAEWRPDHIASAIAFLCGAI